MFVQRMRMSCPAGLRSRSRSPYISPLKTPRQSCNEKYAQFVVVVKAPTKTETDVKHYHAEGEADAKFPRSVFSCALARRRFLANLMIPRTTWRTHTRKVAHVAIWNKKTVPVHCQVTALERKGWGGATTHNISLQPVQCTKQLSNFIPYPPANTMAPGPDKPTFYRY